MPRRITFQEMDELTLPYIGKEVILKNGTILVSTEITIRDLRTMYLEASQSIKAKDAKLDEARELLEGCRTLAVTIQAATFSIDDKDLKSKIDAFLDSFKEPESHCKNCEHYKSKRS